MRARWIPRARRVVELLTAAVVCVVVSLVGLTSLAPLTGREVLTIAGGSMEPTLPVGSIVVVAPADQPIVVGDVVTIRGANGVLVTHRVWAVADTADGLTYVLKGDANASADPGRVPARAVLGRVGLALPIAGFALVFLSSAAGVVTILSILASLILAQAALGRLDAQVSPGRSVGTIAPEGAWP